MEDEQNRETVNRIIDESNKLRQYSDQLQRRIKYLEKQQQKFNSIPCHTIVESTPGQKIEIINIDEKKGIANVKFVSQSLHLKKPQDKDRKIKIQQAKLEGAEELRRELKSQNENLHRLKEMERKAKEANHRIKQKEERQARENVGIFWEKRLLLVSLKRNKKIEETRKAIRAVQSQVELYEERQRQLIDILNCKTTPIERLKKRYSQRIA